jgi:D-beta-D-heptose 7-phosphate kinase/D-beta-D-heptose 1-phosphate adenosyltransferase
MAANLSSARQIMIQKLRSCVANFTGKKILVVGDLMVDEFIWGESTRLSPEAPVPIVLSKREEKIPGGAFNVVNNLLELGAQVFIVGRIGDDHLGVFIQKFLERKKIDQGGIIVSREMPTILKTRVIAGNQQVVRLDREKVWEMSHEEANRSITYIQSVIGAIDGIIISDYAKGVVSEYLLNKLIPLANNTKIPVAVDPQVKNFLLYKNVFTLTPNHHEAEGAFGRQILNEEMLLQAGKKLLKKLKAESLLITRGKDGMTLFRTDDSYEHIPTVARKVFDVTGAGDTVISVLMLAYVSGVGLKEAAVLANIAAGYVVGELGTATITRSILLRNMKPEYLH